MAQASSKKGGEAKKDKDKKNRGSGDGTLEGTLCHRRELEPS